MNSTPYRGAQSAPDPLDELPYFHEKLPTLANGEDVGLLTAHERMWIMIFRATANRFPQLTTNESFGESFRALTRCMIKGKAYEYGYVTTSCRRANWRYTRFCENKARTRRTLSRKSRERPPEILIDYSWNNRADTRIDVDDAIEFIGCERPTYAAALRMRKERRTCGEIAEALGISKRQAIRILQNARTRFQEVMQSYEP